jgi:hypothetical protein
MRTAPPRSAKLPTKRAWFLVGAGFAAVGAAIYFAALALTARNHADAQSPGRTAGGFAMGGVFAASLGVPALKRQSQARQALASWGGAHGFTLHGRDDVRGEVDGIGLSVRIAYGRGPYASRGASELVVVVRPETPEAGWLADSEPFDDVAVIERHIERLVARGVRRAAPPALEA